jgi:hypothetical protein
MLLAGMSTFFHFPLTQFIPRHFLKRFPADLHYVVPGGCLRRDNVFAIPR